MLTLDNIAFSFPGREVLRDICFSLHPGEFVAVLGMNGSGKSTLLKTINGILPPKQGAVFIDQQALSGMSGNERARKMAYMPQKGSGMACTVFDAVLLGRKPHIRWGTSARDLAMVEKTLLMLDLERYALRSVSELSGGEFQKVALARALVQEPRILLLDEPANHLDIKNQLEIMSILKKITQELNLVTVTVLHDLSCALRFADRFLLLREGRLHACGDKTVMSTDTIRQVFTLEAQIHEINGIPVVLPLESCG